MPNLYELTTNLHNLSGNYFSNVFHYEIDDSGGPTPFNFAKALITAWDSLVSTSYSMLLGQDVFLDYYKAKRVATTGGPSCLKLSSISGGGSTDSVSAGLCGDVQWQNSNPSNRAGHSYIGGIYQAAVDGDRPAVGFVADVATWVGVMLVPVVLGGGMGNAVFSTFQRKAGTWTHVSAGNLSPKVTLLNKRTVPLV